VNYKNFIAGQWVDSRSGQRFEDRNPANWDEVIGVFPSSDSADVEAAVAAAQDAYESWHRVPAPKRGEVLRRAGELMLKYKEELAQLMTREMGKVLKEARGDVQEGIDTALYAGGEGRRWFGQTVPSELPNKVCLVFREPIGVWGLITPWNFPIAIPSWKIFPALLCGNTLVFKPATDTPVCAARLVEILLEAGLPEGCINLVFGSGLKVGEAILAHPGVRGVSFTGSSEVGRRIGEVTGKTLKRCSLELGGKNAQIVLEDADMDLALEGVLWGAFGTTGQRCTATSRLILEEAIHDDFLERLSARVESLRIGNGLDEAVEMGPLINKRQLETVDSYVKIGLTEGAKLVLGGERYTDKECAKGWFYSPTIFCDVRPEMRIAQEEIFGPVLSVLKVKALSEAIPVLNSVRYGLSSSVYTRDVNRALKAAEEVESGIIYINGPTIGAECHLPFGGVKDTGNGHREGGLAVFDIFSELKTVYIDYSGKLQKAQIDTWKEG
jgi:aldehyde dehydrogenase (NAD+)